MFFSSITLNLELNTSLKEHEDSQATGYTQRAVITSDTAMLQYRIFQRYRRQQVTANSAWFKTARKYSMCKKPTRKNIYWWSKYQMHHTKGTLSGHRQTNRFTRWRRSGVAPCFIEQLLSLHKLYSVDWEMTWRITRTAERCSCCLPQQCPARIVLDYVKVHFDTKLTSRAWLFSQDKEKGISLQAPEQAVLCCLENRMGFLYN